MFTPYFREWSNMRHHKGKSFISPPRLFRAERALYFPNLRGRTLASKKDTDTTPVVSGKISIVSVFSSTWAERQIATFVGEKQHPALYDVFRDSGIEGGIQKVEINVEENSLKAWLIKLFLPLLRRKLPKEAHGRYFIVRRGVTDEIRDSIGLLNSKVGYVYLLDRDCKIRWAGSGISLPEENTGLLKGARRLLEDWRKEKQTSSLPERPEVEEEARVAAAA